MTAVGLIRVLLFILSKIMLASNHLQSFLFYFPLSLYPGQKIGTSNPYHGKKTGTLNLFHGPWTGTIAFLKFSKKIKKPKGPGGSPNFFGSYYLLCEYKTLKFFSSSEFSFV
jgi:hypothetical protein